MRFNIASRAKLRGGVDRSQGLLATSRGVPRIPFQHIQVGDKHVWPDISRPGRYVQSDGKGGPCRCESNADPGAHAKIQSFSCPRMRPPLNAGGMVWCVVSIISNSSSLWQYRDAELHGFSESGKSCHDIKRCW